MDQEEEGREGLAHVGRPVFFAVSSIDFFDNDVYVLPGYLSSGKS
jgi:hypothetical protein